MGLFRGDPRGRELCAAACHQKPKPVSIRLDRWSANFQLLQRARCSDLLHELKSGTTSRAPPSAVTPPTARAPCVLRSVCVRSACVCSFEPSRYRVTVAAPKLRPPPLPSVSPPPPHPQTSSPLLQRRKMPQIRAPHR